MFEREVLYVLLAYCVGSFSPAHLLGLAKGVDLRKHGEFRNFGASNARSVFGWKWGASVCAADIVKGALVSAGALWLRLDVFFVYLAAIIVVVGHRFPFYLQFQGGKGVAAGSGSFLLLLLYYRDLNSVLFCLGGLVYALCVSPKFRRKLVAVRQGAGKSV